MEELLEPNAQGPWNPSRWVGQFVWRVFGKSLEGQMSVKSGSWAASTDVIDRPPDAMCCSRCALSGVLYGVWKVRVPAFWNRRICWKRHRCQWVQPGRMVTVWRGRDQAVRGFLYLWEVSFLWSYIFSSAPFWTLHILIGRLSLFFYFCLFFFLPFSGAAPKAYGGFQARGLIRAVTTGLYHSHSNSGSKPHLRPIHSRQRRILNPLSKARDQTRNPMVPS